MNKIYYRPIGIIHTPFKEPKGTPIQPTASASSEGIVELFPEFEDGLLDLEGFSHIFLIFHLHLSTKSALKAKPFMDENEHGIFAIRAPGRPNPIGLSVVRLKKIEGRMLFIAEVDILDGTPLLDIKPYIPEFDMREATKSGWIKEKVHKLEQTTDDGRFAR